MATKQDEVTGWTGWIVFAGVLMILQGIFQSIAGLTALLNSEWITVSEGEILLWDFTTWGWVHLIVGLIVLIAGFQIMQGATWARFVGILAAILSAVGALASVDIYPIWSIIIIVIDVLIIYAITVHGDEMKALSAEAKK